VVGTLRRGNGKRTRVHSIPLEEILHVGFSSEAQELGVLADHAGLFPEMFTQDSPLMTMLTGAKLFMKFVLPTRFLDRHAYTDVPTVRLRTHFRGVLFPRSAIASWNVYAPIAHPIPEAAGGLDADQQLWLLYSRGGFSLCRRIEYRHNGETLAEYHPHGQLSTLAMGAGPGAMGGGAPPITGTIGAAMGGAMGGQHPAIAGAQDPLAMMQTVGLMQTADEPAGLDGMGWGGGW